MLLEDGDEQALHFLGADALVQVGDVQVDAGRLRRRRGRRSRRRSARR